MRGRNSFSLACHDAKSIGSLRIQAGPNSFPFASKDAKPTDPLRIQAGGTETTIGCEFEHFPAGLGEVDGVGNFPAEFGKVDGVGRFPMAAGVGYFHVYDCGQPGERVSSPED